ncbi:hypothetical protein ACLOJK_007452 [Asimina triloba]
MPTASDTSAPACEPLSTIPDAYDDWLPLASTAVRPIRTIHRPCCLLLHHPVAADHLASTSAQCPPTKLRSHLSSPTPLAPTIHPKHVVDVGITVA